MLLECRKNALPHWWAAVVLFAPVTAPFFFYRSRKEESMVLIMVFLCLFSIVAGIEFYLYARYMDVNKYADLPPVTRQMIRLSEELRQSTIDLDTALIKLENLSKVESRTREIEKTIDFIGKLRIIMTQNKAAIDKLVIFAKNHKDFFEKKELFWVMDIQQFYKNYNVVQHYKSLQKYLDNFEELLRYTYTNFSYITEHKSAEHLKNYDEYYLRYRRAVDSHNRFNVKRIEFQNKYLLAHPEIKAYLPGERQTETFRLWE